MKRLGAYIGFTVFITFAIVLFFGFYGFVTVLITSFILALVGLIFKKLKPYKKSIICISIVAVLSLVYFGLYAHSYSNNTIDKTNEVKITARIIKNPYKSYNLHYYELETVKVADEHKRVRLLLRSVEELDAEYGDKISGTVSLEKCDEPYYKSKKILYLAKGVEFYAKYKVIKSDSKDIGHLINFVENKLTTSVKILIPGNEGDLCSAIALGDKYGLDKDLRDKFSKVGLSHIIVVSGMHLSILSGFVLKLFERMPKLRRYNLIRVIFVTFVVLTFMAISGFTTSIVRSGIMTLISIFSMLLRRSYDSLNSLGIAGLIQSIVNPFVVGDVGLLLSYSAILGIVILSEPVSAYIRRKTGYNKRLQHYLGKAKPNFKDKLMHHSSKLLFDIIECFLVSCCALVFVTPILVNTFGGFNILTAVLTLPVAPVISALMIVTLICSVMWYVPYVSVLTYPLAMIAYYLSKWIISVVDFGSKLTFAQKYVDDQMFNMWLVISVVIIIFALLLKKKGEYLKPAIIISLILFVFLLPLNTLLKAEKTYLSIYPCGKGVTAVLESDNEVNVLSCGGKSEYTSDIIYNLRKTTDKINLLIVPGISKDVSRYATELLSEFDVDNILLYYMSSTNEETYSIADKLDNYYQFSRNETYEIQLNDEFTDVVVNKNNHTYQYIYSQNSKILIVPDNGNCKEIPSQYRNADLVILCGVPKKFRLLSYDEIVWSSDEPIPHKLKNVAKIEENILEMQLR